MECLGINEDKKMEMMITIHLVRHGKAEHNRGEDVYGPRAYFSNRYRFSRLVDNGKAQAHNLRTLLRESKFVTDRIYTSPLDRAIETTSIIFPLDSSHVRPQIFVTDDLRELNYSHPCNERKTVNILKLSYPDFDYSLMKNNIDVLFANGDTYNRSVSLIRELKEYVDEWYRENQDRSPIVVLVSHESFLMEFARSYLGVDLESINNCEIVTYVIDFNSVL